MKGEPEKEEPREDTARKQLSQAVPRFKESA